MTPSSPAGPADGGRDGIPFAALRPGRCFDHPALDPSVTRVEPRPCGRPHDGEVVADKTLSGAFSSERTLQDKALQLASRR